MVRDGRVSEPPPEIAGLLQTMVQQQTAMMQQQAALLQVHGETVRMQGLLLEHLLRVPSNASEPTPEREVIRRARSSNHTKTSASADGRDGGAAS